MNEFTRNCLHERFQGDELYHHGVLGMHWGIRRYQPYGHGGYKPDHKGKFEGTKKEAREHAKEIKQDLKEAKRNIYEKAKDVTILGRALKYADKNADQMTRKFDRVTAKTKFNGKDSDARRYRNAMNKYKAAKVAQERVHRAYESGLKELNNQVNTLKKKYGNEKIRDLKYKMTKDNQKILDEKIHTNGEIITYMMQIPVNLAMTVMGSPITMWTIPFSKNNRGWQIAEQNYNLAYNRPDLNGLPIAVSPGNERKERINATH